MREIALDTETTGLDPATGDRIVEIGAVELINHVATGRTFHEYLDPERAMSAEAREITGITDEFLVGKPRFQDVAVAFRDFIGHDLLVIHNAPFDMKFINAEFARVGFDALPMSQAVDTLPMAKKKFPGAQSSLDALCRRFGVDNSAREKHGALLDAELLADVYLELIGGRQPGFELAAHRSTGGQSMANGAPIAKKARPIRRGSRATQEEVERHRALIEELGEDAAWRAPPYSSLLRR